MVGKVCVHVYHMLTSVHACIVRRCKLMQARQLRSGALLSSPAQLAWFHFHPHALSHCPGPLHRRSPGPSTYLPTTTLHSSCSEVTHGGQVVLSESAWASVQDQLPGQAQVRRQYLPASLRRAGVRACGPCPLC